LLQCDSACRATSALVLEEQVQSIPWKRAAEPAEIGRLAVFLASADRDYVTGATYFMDGGLMINVGQGA